MKINTLIIAALILCISLLLGMKVLEGFATKPEEDLSYDDYIKLMLLAKRATEIDLEAVKIGLKPQAISQRMGSPKENIKRILDYVPNKNVLKTVQSRDIELNKMMLCPNINTLKKNLDEINTHIAQAGPKNFVDKSMYDMRDTIQKQIAILNSPIADNFKAMCSVEIPLLT